MPDGIFNVAKGSIAELARRVNANDPTNSAFKIVILKASGLVDDETLRRYDTLADILAGASDEATNSGYARITLDNTASITITVSDVLDTLSVDFPDQTLTAVAASGGAWGKLLLVYDGDTTGGTDANIIPCSYHDFVITPDGRDIDIIVTAGGFFVVEDQTAVGQNG